ncbi:MAG TPA: hypothetical protein H9845_05715 [Candidatus Agathobaculum pullicola]|nr:hypothetical protein [Candidatus Agathobaculum pullicola]
MALVKQVRGAFPGLETTEAITEHRATVLHFIAQSSAICAIDAEDITVTTYPKDAPDGQAARAFYKRLGLAEGKLTEAFGHPVQELIWKRQSAGQA